MPLHECYNSCPFTWISQEAELRFAVGKIPLESEVIWAFSLDVLTVVSSKVVSEASGC